ncbi:molybdate ABC transporter substrate-binding protein [Aquimarina litoralis]|nr:molybdate ABC transporter substrate-binding protein [Aquimarina litoralis]
MTIAAAANMQFAIKEISDAFTKQTGISCDVVISSSGKLTAQIKEGAPYDVFVSANMKYPREIFKAGFAVEKPKVYAYGQLVLWSLYEEIDPSIEGLSHENIQSIALPNPKTAPYGHAAIEILKANEVYELVADKLVYGESIAQTNQFITSKSSEIGFTAKSVVMYPNMGNQGHWQALDTTQYKPIEQGVILIKKEDSDIINSTKFYDFLFSEEAQKILEDFGYLLDNRDLNSLR